MNNFVQAFEPAIQHALFETFISYFVQLELNTHQVKYNDQVKYKMSILCKGVMKILLMNPQKVPKMDIANKALCLRALQGLVEYVTWVDADMDEIKEIVSAAKRNGLSHNGAFLMAFFPSFSSSSDQMKASNTKSAAETEEVVKKCIHHIEETIESASKNPNEEIKDAVTNLVNALKNKEHHIDISEQTKKRVIILLENKLKTKKGIAP